MLAAITKAGTSDCVRETSHPSLWKHAPIREVFYFFFFPLSLLARAVANDSHHNESKL